MVVIGAGPAGLTAAYELIRRGHIPVVLESDDIVGGISRTVERDGWRFDIGGHRFFTKVAPVEEFWHEILPDEDFMLRPRKSRIYYQGKFYDYPLRAMNALTNLGVLEALRCVASYAWVRFRPPEDQTNFEGWVAARFGWRLYRHFFKTYTEKVWGHPGSEMGADWAAQRIKNLSLASAIANALLPKRNQKDITSLIEEFQYPKLGPGMMWERCAEKVREAGGTIEMRHRVVRIRRGAAGATAVVSRGPDGREREDPASAVVSSMPLSELVRVMDPPAPAEVRAAADDLAYRDFLTVALVVPADRVPWNDNWIYIHDASVRTMRIQNFGSWSPYLVKNGRNVLGLEYTVDEGDAAWTAPDDELVEQGKAELGKLGLVDPSAVEAGYVVRMPKAYPYYDADYHRNVDTIRKWIESEVPNVHPVGRNGMHRYNNADHSMYTAMLTVENLLGAHHDVWSVNVEEEYHETLSPAGTGGGARGTGRDAPILPKPAAR
ncbi:FAD-dependent oxidoreductase [Acidimicrobiaceae bacterium USS-CC1]|uniref:FAD-dependent oxidoreductase n=1 Tax=Acidiferrimicrobium australe TaxID=2664430 RepID=A0ABW9QUG2_9ACTN|nr:FAD-dependent oxidoreductase [Acidiferrimicrobium australe]